MATIAFTKMFGGFSYPVVPDWYTLPGAMYAAQIAVGEAKEHRVVKDGKGGMDTEAAKQILNERKRNSGRISSGTPAEWAQNSQNKFAWTKEQMGNGVKVNPIIIIDYEDFLSGGSGYSYITLNTVPGEVNFDPNPNFATIASIGRNAPFYHYTGSEDTLTLKLDWYAQQENRGDVIRNCRWLATRSKANGYYEDPHRVIVVWGEGHLFSKDVWIITKAAFKMSQFQRHQGMLPNQAYQDLELKKVIEMNTDYSDHMGFDIDAQLLSPAN